MRGDDGWRRRAKYLPLAVPILGILELGLHFYFSHRAPTAKDWAEVRPVVASWYKPGDVVVVAPSWAEPMARWKFGDALMPLRDVARPDVTRYGAAIEVSTLGSHEPELAGWKILREAKQGSFTLRALANPLPRSLTYDFVDHVSPESLEVRIEKDGQRTACTFSNAAPLEGGGLGGPPLYPASRFVCPGEPVHVFVGVTVVDDDKARPRRCIWAHPPGGQSRMVAVFRGVPLGTEIHGHAGLGWLIERDRGVPPFTIRILVGTNEVTKIVHEPGESWKAFAAPLGAAAGQTADVEFEVSAAPGGTHVCFEADSR